VLASALGGANAAEVHVDRLVSRHIYPDARPSLLSRGYSFFKRMSGFANAGTASENGKDASGQLKNKNNYEVSFYHLNDVHAHLDHFRASGSSCNSTGTQECLGGYPRVKALLDKERPTKMNNLLLNAGDEFQGTLFYNLYKGEAISDVLNQIGFDAFTLGNHEFDDGEDLLAEFLSNLTFPTISSNIHSQNSRLAYQLLPYQIWPRYSIAVLAVTTPDTKTTAKPSETTIFEDPVTAAVRTVGIIRKRHPYIKTIVALTHIGYEKDIELAKATTDIALVIGGHSHTLLENSPNATGPYPTIVDNAAGDEVFVVTSYRWGERIGYIDVELDSRGRIVSYEGAPIRLTNQDPATAAEDAGVRATVDKYGQRLLEYARTVVGHAEGPLGRDSCQQGECALGNLVTDALAGMTASNTTSRYNTPIAPPSGVKLAGALLSVGAIRPSSLSGPGPITMQHVLEIFPFGNAAVEVEFTGRELWRVFEGIVSRANVDSGTAIGNFVQVSAAIRLAYNPAGAPGSRLVSLTVANGEAIGGETGENSETVYRMATSDFLATGGDSFWPAKTPVATFGTLDETLTSYMKGLGAGTSDGVGRVKAELDGRIAVAA